jgi:nucleoside-diphosphate-sugar epimerase
MMKKKIIITGGSGFIGTNLVEYLKKYNHDLLNFDINSPRNRSHDQFWVQGDIRDFARVKCEFGNINPNIIVHLAARTDLHGKTLSDYSANTDGVINVIQAARKCKNLQLILFASSRLVCRIGYGPKSENDYCPTTLYGESKIIGENLVRDNVDIISCPWLIFRPTSIWGPWFDTPYKEFFMSIIHRHYVHPKGRSIKKSFGYVGNTVYAINHLINNFPAELNGKTIYMCDYEPIDVLDWGTQIATMYGVKRPREVSMRFLEFLAKCGDMLKTMGYKEPPLTSFRLDNILTDMIYDTSLLEKYCGPLPYSQAEGIKATLDWLQRKENKT